MKTYVRAAGLFAALPAFQIIRGIYRPAFWAGKVLQHLRVPCFVSGCPDSLLRFPQLDPVRRRCLKRFQVLAGILRALTAEVHPFISGAFRHGADALTVKASFFRTASVAMQFFDRTLHALASASSLAGSSLVPIYTVQAGQKSPQTAASFLSMVLDTASLGHPGSNRISAKLSGRFLQLSLDNRIPRLPEY